MTMFLGAGYSTWRADSANSVFGQFKGHNSGVHGGIWLVIELVRNIMPTIIFTEFDRERKPCGPRPHAAGVPIIRFVFQTGI